MSPLQGSPGSVVPARPKVPSPEGDERGFGLIEAVIALVLLGVMLTSMIPAMTHYMQINSRAEIRTGAVAVAQQELDALRAVQTWPTSGSQTSVTIGNAVYIATLTHEQFCDVGGCYAGARLVRMEVTHDGRSLYGVETVFTELGA